MIKNAEAEVFFAARSAHSDVGSELLESVKELGEFEVCGNLKVCRSPYIVTADIVFCGAADMNATFWRLRPIDQQIAIATGAEQAAISPEWVRIILFRPDWPKPDLKHWALRAYDFARTGK